MLCMFCGQPSAVVLSLRLTGDSHQRLAEYPTCAAHVAVAIGRLHPDTYRALNAAAGGAINTQSMRRVEAIEASLSPGEIRAIEDQ